MITETIKDGKKVLAIIIKGNTVRKYQFFSPENFPLQIGAVGKKSGDKIRAHLHNEPLRTVRTTQEFLYIEKGKVRVSIYNDSGKVIAKRVLKQGDKILSAAGGHGFEILEDTVFFEVKQGPYPGYDKAKTYLE
ncbi:hypothetical protein ISR94_01180 [Candidatus Microgenomates bacterium]|nr:hypothetical protein [Candidatus Microgenomates bacterium]